MRAAVYNQHLRTLGGGERYSTMLAGVLAGMPEITSVELIGHDAPSVTDLEHHLGLELPGVTLRDEPDRGDAWVSSISAEYDLFVNASYMSRVESRATHSAYAVYFPTPWDHDLTSWQKRLSRVLGPRVLRAVAHYEFGLGWFPPEGGRRRSWSWTSGAAELGLPAGPTTHLALQVGRPGASSSTELVLESEGQVLGRQRVEPDGFTTLQVVLPASDRPRLVRLRSETFSPPLPDRRELGVAVSSVRVGDTRPGVRTALGNRLPYLLRDSGNLSFLDSYQMVVSISDYTALWVERLWGAASRVLYPPVHTSATPAAAKQRQILSIGRFFDAGRGHSKKQLEMVRAFASAQDRGALHGWSYHLVGGCSAEDEGYLDQVRRAAGVHPVHVHANAPRATVEQLLASSSVFWHATGLGEDPDTRPWAMEHFGITTVEAMAAGCVPVVIALAGQREIVRNGVDGFLFTSLDELVSRTVSLAEDDELRRKLVASAELRADEFSEHAFAEHCQALVRELVGAR